MLKRLEYYYIAITMNFLRHFNFAIDQRNLDARTDKLFGLEQIALNFGDVHRTDRYFSKKGKNTLKSPIFY